MASSFTNTLAYDGAGNPTSWNYSTPQVTRNQTRTFNADNQETTLGEQGEVFYAYDGDRVRDDRCRAEHGRALGL